MIVRNLNPGESLPDGLQETQTPYLVPEWTWVVEEREKGIVAVIITAFCHGFLLIWRIVALESAASNWFLAALPQVFQTAKERGCVAFTTILADKQPSEVKIARIVAKLPNSALLPFQGVVAVGKLE